MIGFLNGKVEFKDGSSIIVNVNGVGYKVIVPSNIFSNSSLNDLIKLFIYTHVREDALDLYGFSTNSDLKLFQNIISVSGIGPKTAIGIFSLNSSKEVVNAIIKGDVEFFTQVPRLGKKNAQKLIIELKSKLGSTDTLDLSDSNSKESLEIVAALKNFGFTGKEASEAIKNVNHEGSTTEEKIRLALKFLGK